VAIAATFVSYGVSEMLHCYGFFAVFVTALTLRNSHRGHDFQRDMNDITVEIERIAMVLTRNIAKARKFHDAIKQGQSFNDVAKFENLSRRRVMQIIDLAFLAPAIVRSVVAGEPPLGLTTKWLSGNPPAGVQPAEIKRYLALGVSLKGRKGEIGWGFIFSRVSVAVRLQEIGMLYEKISRNSAG
jgi:hypothetical protein